MKWSMANAADAEPPRGGPIAGLVLAIPVSRMRWGIVMFVLFQILK